MTDETKPPKSKPDPEFLAMRSIVRTLNKLPPSARQRVLGYAIERVRFEPQTSGQAQEAPRYRSLATDRPQTEMLWNSAAAAAGGLLG